MNNAKKSSRALLALYAIRTAKAGFERSMLEHAALHVGGENSDTSIIPPEDMRALKSAGVSQIAELFYMVEEVEAHKPDRLKLWLESHNQAIGKKISELNESKKGFTATGISKQRISDGLLTDKQIKSLIDEAEYGVFRFDQSSLACLLVEGMSVESCRTMVLLLDKYGFLKRIGSNNVRIQSLGILERMYREHLMSLLDQIQVERPAA